MVKEERRSKGWSVEWHERQYFLEESRGESHRACLGDTLNPAAWEGGREREISRQSRRRSRQFSALQADTHSPHYQPYTHSHTGFFSSHTPHRGRWPLPRSVAVVEEAIFTDSLRLELRFCWILPDRWSVSRVRRARASLSSPSAERDRTPGTRLPTPPLSYTLPFPGLPSREWLAPVDPRGGTQPEDTSTAAPALPACLPAGT